MAAKYAKNWANIVGEIAMLPPSAATPMPMADTTMKRPDRGERGRLGREYLSKSSETPKHVITQRKATLTGPEPQCIISVREPLSPRSLKSANSTTLTN